MQETVRATKKMGERGDGRRGRPGDGLLDLRQREAFDLARQHRREDATDLTRRVELVCGAGTAECSSTVPVPPFPAGPRSPARPRAPAMVRWGSSRIDPARKQTAPTKVPRFVRATLSSCPLGGDVGGDPRTRRRRWNPARFNAVIHHRNATRLPGEGRRSSHSSARPTSSTKQMEPRASGRQIEMVVGRGAQADQEQALSVVRLNHSVPMSWIAAAHQSPR